MSKRGQWAELRPRRIRQIDLQPAGTFRNHSEHPVVHRALDEQARARHARLAAGLEDAVRHSGRGCLEVRVRTDDVRRLPAQFKGDRHQLLRCDGGDATSARRSTRERHELHAWMADQCITRNRTGPGEDVDDARRQAGIEGGLAERQTGRGSDLGWLQDHRVACGERGGHLLRLHREGRVPGGDRSDDPIGLVDGHRKVLAAGRCHFRPQRFAHRRVVAERRCSRSRLRSAFRQDLAILDHLRAREILAARFDDVRELGEQACPLVGQHVAPRAGVRGLGRGLDRRIHMACRGGAHLVVDLTCRWVHRHDHIVAVGPPFAAYQQRFGIACALHAIPWARWAADAPAILPNTAPLVSPLPPG